MASVGDEATTGEKELKTNWPVETGLTAGTTKQRTTSPVLEPQEDDLTTSTERWGSI